MKFHDDAYFQTIQKYHDFQEKYLPGFTIDHLSLTTGYFTALNIWYFVVGLFMRDAELEE